MSALTSIINTVVSIINGIIVGALSFLLGILDGLDSLDDIVIHLLSSVSGLFGSVVTLGTSLFPFIPSEWMALIESAIIVLAIGLLIKRRVKG